MTVFYARGSTETSISREEAKRALQEVFRKIGERKKVCIVPPDFTRFHSRAGLLTQLTYEHYGDAVSDVIPALGSHEPISNEHRVRMFGDIPAALFRVHDWRNDVVTIGHIPAEVVREASDGHLDEPWPAQLNKLVWEGGHDLILSIGQVVPHEVMGMANFNKNLFVGVGGKEAIDYSHFIGASYGMERMMGRADNPLRNILNRASRNFLGKLPLVYVLTVVGPMGDEGDLALRGLYVGDDEECFRQAAELSVEVNFTAVPHPLPKVVVHLDADEFRSTWLGNKAIYRTRMAIADGGELIILAPGVDKFGEDPRIDTLIRKFGYRTTPEIMGFLRESLELRTNLSAAAHLIHGSPEERFRVTYCPGGLSREEVEEGEGRASRGTGGEDHLLVHQPARFTGTGPVGQQVCLERTEAGILDVNPLSRRACWGNLWKQALGEPYNVESFACWRCGALMN
ncbi:unnamed protein product [Discosporangium mesarthrocarpum]